MMHHRLVWSGCGLWLLLLVLFLVHNGSCSAGDLRLHYKPEPRASGHINRSLSQSDLLDTLQFAGELIDRRKSLETSITQSRIQLARDSTSFALLVDSWPDAASKRLDRQAQLVLRASSQLLNRNCLGPNGRTESECARDIETVPLPATSASLAFCRAAAGNGTSTYRRLLPAAYDDGLHRMKYARSLPLPKTISDHFFASAQQSAAKATAAGSADAGDGGVVDERRNNLVVQWSQFVEHDLAKTVFQTMENNSPIECCDEEYRNAPPRYLHPACAPLKVESKGADISCLNYVRSALGVSGKCTFGPAQQRNQASGSLDLSQVYGHSEKRAAELRRHVGGELLAGQHQQADGSYVETLPEATAAAEAEADTKCLSSDAATGNGQDVTYTCYESGDSRCNANPLITPLYTLFLRSHNRLARQIGARKPHWPDERIFRKARRINTVIYQRIVFDEWLPIVVGDSLAAQINLTRQQEQQHDPEGAAVSNEWATAASRFYYSMMPGSLHLTGEPWSGNDIAPATTLDLQQEFYRPRSLSRAGSAERLMAALLHQPAMAMDTAYVDDVSQFLFRQSGAQPIGTDVLALDIQRGRDHGLAGYTQYVELCTGRPVGGWDQLRTDGLMSAESVQRLRTIYRHLAHVDLIVGGVAERAREGATVGPTFACLFGEQFAHLRRTASSAVDQGASELLAQRYGGAQFLCENSELQFVPRNIFHVPSDVNPLVECGTLQKFCESLNVC